MKKMLTILSTVLVMALLFSVSAFAAQTNRTAPGDYDLGLKGVVAGNTSYTISIPSDTKEGLALTATSQEVGTLSCTAFSSNENKKVVVNAVQKTALTNGSKAVDFTVGGVPVEYTDIADATSVTITPDADDLAAGLIAGDYVGTMTFTVSLVPAA